MPTLASPFFIARQQPTTQSCKEKNRLSPLPHVKENCCPKLFRGEKGQAQGRTRLCSAKSCCRIAGVAAGQNAGSLNFYQQSRPEDSSPCPGQGLQLRPGAPSQKYYFEGWVRAARPFRAENQAILREDCCLSRRQTTCTGGNTPAQLQETQ